MKLVLAVLLFAIAAVPAYAHPCDEDARARAVPLLRLHFDDPQADVGVGEEIKELAPVKALQGSGKFDVLEVWGYIYKAEYRMRFIYAQIPDTCVLMGQEIIEASDPY
ncbi:MAG TPA: hypothetical protein VFK86_12425 [Bauldia sp.]|nr:hypothetical protein [Bauldia sp.]